MTSISGWDAVAFGNAGTWVSGGTPSTSNADYWDGDIPWMSSKSMTNFHVCTSDRLLTPLGAQNGTKLVPKDVILMVVRGMSLKTEFRMGITQREVALSQDLKGLIPGPGFNPLFLAYAIRAKTPEVLAMVDEAGHGTGRLQTDRLFAMELPRPGFAEQRAIAGTLGALDDKIESNHRSVALALDLLDALASQQAALQPRVSLRSIAQLTKTVARPAEYGDQIVAHYSLPAFDAGARPERVAASSVRSNKVALAGPAILVSRLNPRFNRTWWVTSDANEVSFASPEFAMLQAADRRALAAVWLAVRDVTFRDEITKRVTGTSGSHQRIRPDDMLAIEVPDSRRMSDEVSATALTLLERIESLRNEVDVLSSVLDALLPELLSGHIRVPVRAES